MSKYFNPRLLNAVIAGTGMRNPVRPHVILGSEDGEFVRGDLMDANAIQEFINQKISDLVNNAPEALDTLKELADAIQENGVADLVTKGQLEAALDNKVDKSDMSTMDANGHEYVEIGGIKWATMNIGANSVTDTGLYFQWGDTQGYAADQIGNGEGLKQFNWNTYKYATDLQNSNLTMTKYNYTDNKDTLDISDDAAAANWGGTWRMPTYKEFQTLRDSVTTQYVTNYNGSGVKGILMTDKTDSSKTLFFPACGHALDSYLLYTGTGYYWHSSVGYPVKYGVSLTFSSSSITWLYSNAVERKKGCPVRGVLGLEDKYATKALVEEVQSNIVQSDWNQSDSAAIDYIKNKPDLSQYATKQELYSLPDANGHTYVDLGLPSGTLWATMNIGASSETTHGDAYMWGKTTTYNHSDTPSNYTELTLSPEHDTAHLIWGGDWYIPCNAQWRELCDFTTKLFISDYNNSGVNVIIFTGINGNSVIFPLGSPAYVGPDYNNTPWTDQSWFWTNERDDLDVNAGSIKTFAIHGDINNSGSSQTGLLDCGYCIRPVLNARRAFTNGDFSKIICIINDINRVWNYLD